MEWSDRWAVAMLDSLLHVSGEIASSVHGQCVRTTSLEPAACVRIVRILLGRPREDAFDRNSQPHLVVAVLRTKYTGS